MYYILIICSALCVLGVVILGFIRLAFYKTSPANSKFENKLMMLRVGLQAISILLIFLAYMFYK